MDLGAHLPNQGPLATREAVMTFCREAEKVNIASLWVSDHVIFPRSATGSYPGGRFVHPPDKAYLAGADEGCPGAAARGGRQGATAVRHARDLAALRPRRRAARDGAREAIDTLAQYKRLGLTHVLLEFRRDDLARMLEILGQVAGPIRRAVDAA